VRSLISRLLGTDRSKVIAVFASTREDAERAVKHAQTSGATLPIWVWCLENVDDSAPIAGCDRLLSGKAAFGFPKGLRSVWPALSIVSWTCGRGGVWLKLLPLIYPPFRVLIFNEAGGFFAPRPGALLSHVSRRLRDSVSAKAQLAFEWSAGALKWTRARIWDAVQWVFWKLVGATLATCRFITCTLWRAWPLLWKTWELSRDIVLLVWSLIWRGGERVRDVLFVVLAHCASPTASLSHAVVRRARRRHGSALSVGAAFDPRFTEVSVPNRGWSRRDVIAAATRSDAEFIVLRKKGERASAAPLIAIARETGAFAVARQTAWSAWRRTAVTKHPFRRLQPGEVSEVFAPFSSLIVVRRAMLLRLGVPRAITLGSALMTLFWRASAAGLRTLVAGHEDHITDEPEMALEDAEFALRLTLSPSLSKLAPARPARYRGNLAWSPFHTRDLRRKPRVLVVSPYLPFPLSHGGAVRIYNLCRALAGRVDFTLACFHEANEKICYDELHEVFREVYVVDLDEKRPDPTVPKQVAEYRNPAMSDLIRNLCSSGTVDLVQLEYTQMAEYREHAGRVPVILAEHDITFTLYSQLAEFRQDIETRKEYERWRDFEREALQCSDAVWTMSDDERAVAIEHRAPRDRTHVIPNGVDIRRFTPVPKPLASPTILFVGSFRHLPNLLAYESLRTAIMPEVWRECPEAILHVIAGPQHEKAAGAAGKMSLLEPHSQVVIEGFVSDVRPAYRSADVVAVPLPLSAGTNIKLLEAMACGRSIVSTASGCRGLKLTSGVQLIVTELDSSFAAAILALLRDESLRQRMAVEARRTAEQRFGWEAIAEDAFDCYAELISGRTLIRSIAVGSAEHR
jgi:glycosyltransferase involved in cell wall biosynthesis